MFDFAWSEMLVVGVVALVVIGPKDLPQALRAAGRMVGKARGIANEFRQHWEDAMREAELDELRRKAEALTGVGDLKSAVQSVLDPKDEIAAAMQLPDMPSIEPPASNPAPAAEPHQGAPQESAPSHPADAPRS